MIIQFISSKFINHRFFYNLKHPINFYAATLVILQGFSSQPTRTHIVVTILLIFAPNCSFLSTILPTYILYHLILRFSFVGNLFSFESNPSVRSFFQNFPIPMIFLLFIFSIIYLDYLFSSPVV